MALEYISNVPDVCSGTCILRIAPRALHIKKNRTFHLQWDICLDTLYGWSGGVPWYSPPPPPAPLGCGRFSPYLC